MQPIRTSIRNLLSKINSGLIEPKNFSKQSGKIQYKNLDAVKNAINVFSGNEPVELLQKLINSPKYLPGVKSTIKEKHFECLKNISEAFNRATSQEGKKILLPLVANIYPSNFLKSVGFVFGPNLFSLVRKKRLVMHVLFYLIFI